MMITIQALSREIEELKAEMFVMDEEKFALLAAKENLESQNKELEVLREESKALRERVIELENNITLGEKENQDLQARIAELEEAQKRPTIMEEDELDLPNTPPRYCPRQSIGQWSVDRLKNNLSVKSLVTSLEKGKRLR